jgi:hypothetical protein
VSARLAELIRRASGAATPPDSESLGPSPAIAIGLDDAEMVLLASRDGRCFRVVERLARNSEDARALYADSSRPTLDLETVRARYGPEIAVLRLI